MESYKGKTLVISGFPGIGKSYLTKKGKINDILDLDSSEFKKGDNKNWPMNYIQAIKLAVTNGYFKYIFVSSHSEVRKAMRDSDINYICIFPYYSGNIAPEAWKEDRQLKSAYMGRYIRRGDSVQFIRKMEANWEQYISSMKADPMPKICLFSAYDSLRTLLDPDEWGE